MIFLVILLLVLLLVSKKSIIFAVVTTKKIVTMAKKKKVIKAKEPIRIRFKELANGNKSIYLDAYKDGKRAYEFLKLYLIPEVDAAAKTQNQNTLQAAEAIKAQRLLALINGKADIKTTASKMLLSKWIEIYANKQATINGMRIENHMAVQRIVLEYRDAMLKGIDKDYCLGFLEYLKTGFISKQTKQHLSQTTASVYMVTLSTILNAAVRDDLIQLNPFNKIAPSDKISRNDKKRCFLEVEEVAKLMATPYDKLPQIKQAFLFQCFCGLRISDVEALKWGDVKLDSQRPHIELIMQKTKRHIDVDLSEEAIRWMPERGDASNDDKVFALLPVQVNINIHLNRWAKAAQIEKHITTHVARHTFATMSLTAGVDLYTTSKMLGHTNIAVTQIYADIINKKKQEAVAKISGLFNN